MSETNFRVKLNLSKFYQDVRRSSWIYIDNARMLRVYHMKDHICKLFNIKEPCHLLINDTDYLPPNEDIRVLRASETIIVAPGSGLESDKASDDKMGMSKSQNSYDRLREVVPVYHKAAQTDDVSELKTEPSMYNHQEVSSIASNGIINGCLASQEGYDNIVLGETEFESMNESKNVESNLSDNTSVIENYPKKRKRTRSRKSKAKKCNGVQNYENNNEYRPRKPKVIDSQIISSGKHTRFNFMEDDINIIESNSPDTLSSDTPASKFSNAQSLDALVALGQHNPPLTFTKTKVKEEVKVESMWDYSYRSSARRSPKNTGIPSTPASPDEYNRGPPPAENKDILELDTGNGKITVDSDFEKRPIITDKPKVNDIIAFKMLKIGQDCTPQVSAFIVGTVISVNSQNLEYVLRIIDGLNEIQIPSEDFLPNENDQEQCQATIRLKYSNILVPRLLYFETP